MADTTISQLPAGIPSNAAAIPFSRNDVTYQVSPSSMLERAGPVFMCGPTGGRQYDTDARPQLEVQNSRYGSWPGTSFLNAATASNLMLGNVETGTKLMFGQYSTNFSWIQNKNLNSNANYSLMLQPEGGYVGIGLKSQPASTLHVNGTITATGLNVPGTIIQTVYGQDNTEYNFSDPGTTSAPYNKTSTLSINLKYASSKVLINVSAYGYGFRNSHVPGWGLFLFPGNTETSMVNRYPYIHMSSTSVTFITGTLSIIAQHSPGILNPTYRLAVQKASAAGTGEVGQYSAYWTIQEIAQ